MSRIFFLFAIVMMVFTQPAAAQDDAELRIRRALEGRFVNVKMDLPAINSGVYMTFDDTTISFDDARYKSLLKEHGTAIPKGRKSRITGVSISAKGIELDLDGGGAPTGDWAVGSLVLTEPGPVARSDREVQLERMLQQESSPGTAGYLRSELEYERSRRVAQDERNRVAFERATNLRREYIEENRKNWGSKVVIVVRSRKPTVTMRDMMQSLAKYIELLPREPAG